MHTLRDLMERRVSKKRLSKRGHTEGHTGEQHLGGIEKTPKRRRIEMPHAAVLLR